MPGLLGPDGRSISSANFKKERPRALGPSFGQWADRDVTWNQMPGGAVLQFDLSALTLADFRAMRYHPQLNACLSVLTFMLHQADWTIECKDKKIASELDDILRPMWTRLVRALSQSFWAGFSPIAVEYENDVPNRRVVIDKFKDLQPEDCKVHWKKVEGSWTPPGNAVRPKFSVYDGIDQYGAYTIPPENTLWYPLLMENGDHYGRKLLKAAFTPWYFSTLIHLFANRYFERFGEPMPVGRAPFDDEFPAAEGSDKVVSGKEAMEAILMNLRNRGVTTLPSDRDPVTKEFDYTIEYLESQMRGADFERYLTRLDEEMSLALFTPLLLLRNADVGSHNLGVQHTQTWLWCLNAITGDMGEYISRYPLQRLKAYNFSEKAPWATWVPRPMGKENVETLRAIVTGLLSKDKIGVDIDELGVALGMTLKEVRAVTRDDPDGLEPEGDADPDDSERVRGRDKPRGVGEPRATGREISNRIRQQVEKAWRDKRFGSEFKPTMGHRKRMIQALVAEGMAGDKAESATDGLYARLDRWMVDAIGLGMTEYTSPNDFMAMFDRNLDVEIDTIAR